MKNRKKRQINTTNNTQIH